VLLFEKQRFKYLGSLAIKMESQIKRLMNEYGVNISTLSNDTKAQLVLMAYLGIKLEEIRRALK